MYALMGMSLVIMYILGLQDSSLFQNGCFFFLWQNKMVGLKHLLEGMQ